MYLCKDGRTDRFIQYECKNIPQVKNTINELTHSKSTNNEWRAFCMSLKKYGGSDSVDYFYFCDDEERDCSVNIGYDNTTNSYLVWIEI